MLRILILCLAMLGGHTLAEETTAPNPQVIIRTNHGEITVRLFADAAPLTVQNFLRYVDDGFYSNTIFHRVIPNFMIQGGGFSLDLNEKEVHEPVANESKNRLHNERGTLAMARSSDPDSATSQFYINHRTNLRLDWQPGQPGYTVFGEVIMGMSAVDSIAFLPTRAYGGMQDVPMQSVFIKEIVRKPYP